MCLSENMFDTDMIIWQANGSQSTALDLWSRGHLTPQIDTSQDWYTTFTHNKTHTTFISIRGASSRDQEQDSYLPFVKFFVNTLG